MSTHVRENNGVLAAAEKRLLVSLARRLPGWIHSDHLTLLALAAMALAGGAFALSRWDLRFLWIVIGALGLNWLGDSLDGTLARVRRVERPQYGFYVDHVLDIVGISVLMAGLAASPFITPIVAVAFLAAYLLVAGEVFLATAVGGVFRMSFAGLGPTELRILLAMGTLAVFARPSAGIGPLRLFDIGGIAGTVGLLVALVTSAVRNTRDLARKEPRPVRPPASEARLMADPADRTRGGGRPGFLAR